MGQGYLGALGVRTGLTDVLGVLGPHGAGLEQRKPRLHLQEWARMGAGEEVAPCRQHRPKSQALCC